MAPKRPSPVVSRGRSAKSSSPAGGNGARPDGHANGTNGSSARDATLTAAPSVDEVALHDLLRAMRAAGDGDFEVRMSGRHRNPLMADIAQAFNAMVDKNARATR